MRQRISLLLAVLILAGTLSLPTLAAEPGEDNARETGAQNGGVQQVPADPEETQDPRPDPEGTVTWANLDSRIREGSLSALILAENIGGIEGIDYDLMYDDLRRQINDIADLQWMMVLMGNSMGADALDQTYDALRETFDAIKDGELQADNADVVWQLEDTVNQVVSGGETLYITLLGLEQQAADGQRGLAALDRSLEELRLRQTLGQVSQQTVTELEQTRAQTVSQLATLDSNIRQLKIQLQNLIERAQVVELVGDDEHSLVPLQLLDYAEKPPMVFAIQRAGGLVEQQHRRALQDCVIHQTLVIEQKQQHHHGDLSRGKQPQRAHQHQRRVENHARDADHLRQRHVGDVHQLLAHEIGQHHAHGAGREHADREQCRPRAVSGVILPEPPEIGILLQEHRSSAYS